MFENALSFFAVGKNEKKHHGHHYQPISLTNAHRHNFIYGDNDKKCGQG